ncbi:Serine incorporator 3 [Hondaea fermentalgiana]|uniref:Serine incorporator 3 n=1 Tax=Hondaea fermentalgiana TaxID=2315210 RepID=A0A2R5GP17_9STRA|nr:Serine incorporator 3 [Hondaea fermentalgiana]|eukprot:GBG30373.1 Serine incorporator 3 [Hondaea fermentalgiana]
MGAIMSAMSMALCCTCTGLSCACSCLGCCISVATSAAGGISSRVAKFMYLLDLLAVVFLCVVLKYSADDWNWDIEIAGYYSYELGCSNSTNQVNLDALNGTGTEGVYAYCMGDEAVYRVGAATASFFALHVLLSLCGTAFHRGFWLWKLILQAGAIIGFVLMDQDIFDIEGYVWTARVFSVLFLFMQVLLMIGFAYDWNDKWVANAEAPDANEKLWLSLIVASVVGLFACVFVGIVVLYMEFSACSIGPAVTTITLLAVIVLTGLTLFRDRFSEEPGAALPAGVISAYITYLAWAALEANPDPVCRKGTFDGPESNGAIGVGVVIMAISLAWGANQSSASMASIMHGSKGIPEAQGEELGKSAAGAPPVHGGLYEVGEGRTAADMQREQGSQPAAAKAPGPSDRLMVIAFHLAMVVSTFYLSMVLTNWGAAQAETTNEKGQMWLRIGAQWITILLYLWTIVAPAILTNRDFSSNASASTARPSGTSSTGGRTIQMV